MQSRCCQNCRRSRPWQASDQPWWKVRSRIAAPLAPLRDQASHVLSRLAAGRVWWHPDIDSLSSASSPFVSFFLFLFSMFSFDLLSGHGYGSAHNLSVTSSEINCENHRIYNLYLQPEIDSPNNFLSVMISVSMIRDRRSHAGWYLTNKSSTYTIPSFLSI